MLRFSGDGTSAQEIAKRLGIACSTVQDNLKQASAVERNWPLLGYLTDDALESWLFARAGVKQGPRPLAVCEPPCIYT
jgi:transposase